MEFLEDYLISAGERDSLHSDMDCIWSFPPLETISSDECLTTAQRTAAGPRDSVRNGDLQPPNSEESPPHTECCAEGFAADSKGSEGSQSSADVDDDHSDLDLPPAKRQVIEPQYRKASAFTEKAFWEALRRQEQTPAEHPEPSRYYQRSSLRHQETPPSSSESDSSPSPLPERVQEIQSRRPTSYSTFCPETEDSRTPVEKPKVSKVIIPLKNPNPLILKSKITPGNSARQVHLTEEERKLLIQEGLPVPVRYPLSKMDERNLKRIRRKIKNKISAQESRRKKKEYVDTLEEQMKQLENENLKLKERLKVFDKTNQNLISELKNMKQLVETGKVGSQCVRSSTR